LTTHTPILPTSLKSRIRSSTSNFDVRTSHISHYTPLNIPSRMTSHLPILFSFSEKIFLDRNFRSSISTPGFRLSTLGFFLLISSHPNLKSSQQKFFDIFNPYPIYPQKTPNLTLFANKRTTNIRVAKFDLQTSILTFSGRIFFIRHLLSAARHPPSGTFPLSPTVPEIAPVPKPFRYQGVIISTFL